MSGEQSRKSENEITELRTDFKNIKEWNKMILVILTGNTFINVSVLVGLIITFFSNQ